MVWNPFTRAQHDRSSLRYASDLTDKEWALLEPLMPLQPLRGRQRKTDFRDVLAGIFYVLQSGCAWHLLPKDFPPKSTVHGYFQQFLQAGLWDQIMATLHSQMREKEGRDAQPTYAIIDSQSAKTGPNSSEIKGFDAGKKVKGRKRHIVVDTLGFILKADVHSADIQDRDGAANVFDRLTQHFPFLVAVCGDGGYAGPVAQSHCPVELDIVKRNSKHFQVLPIRWIVERTFAWIGINRRMSMDHERYASTTLAFMHIAMKDFYQEIGKIIILGQTLKNANNYPIVVTPTHLYLSTSPIYSIEPENRNVISISSKEFIKPVYMFGNQSVGHSIFINKKYLVNLGKEFYYVMQYEVKSLIQKELCDFSGL